PLRLIGNAVLTGATMALFRSFLVDSQSGMWVFRRETLEKIQPESDGMALSQEIKILAYTHKDLRCLEMPIYYGEPVSGSKLNLRKDGFGNLIQLFELRVTLGRRHRAMAKVAQLPQREDAEQPPARASQS